MTIPAVDHFGSNCASRSHIAIHSVTIRPAEKFSGTRVRAAAARPPAGSLAVSSIWVDSKGKSGTGRRKASVSC